MKIGIVGGGWAGIAAAITAVRAGHKVSLFEASRTLGGRARSVHGTLPDGSPVMLDNGQHILIGAYRDSLHLMRLVGVDPAAALLRRPLTLRFPEGGGLRFPRCFAPLDAVAGIALARGWTLADKMSLMRFAMRWRLARFSCPADMQVSHLCAGLAARVMRELVEPLCVAALNTPADHASGQVFLRVLRDSVLGATGASNLLLPRVDLSTLFPDAAARWLEQRDATVERGARVAELIPSGATWRMRGEPFDLVVLATAPTDAVRLLEAGRAELPAPLAPQLATWCARAGALQHAPITTVYAWAEGARLAHPMLVLRSGNGAQASFPAQFVFDRGQLGGPSGLLAFVASASFGERELLQAQVLAQARAQLRLDLQHVQTLVEKRATFVCSPALQRPAMRIAPGLVACGDYVDGPYPSTLEGAVRSGCAAIQQSANFGS